jgi:hypothetical protein
MLAVLATAAAAAPASASVTLGQLSPGGSGGTCVNADIAQLSATTGNSYVVPAAGTITQWSHNANTGASQMLTFKVLRKVADPNLWKVVGLDGPRPIASGLLNQFPVSIPVQAGDIFDLDAATASTTCIFTGVMQDQLLFRGTTPNLGLGDAGSFNSSNNARLNVSAVFNPSNTVQVGTTTLSKKKGTATLNLTLPNAGTLTASGSGVSASPTGAVNAGPLQVLVKATGKKRKTLNSSGKVKLSVALGFTPTNGDAATQTVAIKLKKNVKK